MFGFIKKCFFTVITFLSYSILNVNSLECVSMNNQECKIRSEIINVNTNEPMFYPYSITTHKCKRSCNTINDPYAKLCVPDTIKTNVKVFNLMSRTNETRHIEWHKTFKCKYRLDTSVCNNKQRWNEDKKTYKSIGIYCIGYITMKEPDHAKINSVNLLYIIINEAEGSVSEKNENKYLTFASTYKNKKV